MWVNNVDGEYYADDPRDFCPHGVYVGGCGYDFMCLQCELDEPEVDEFDILYQIEYLYRSEDSGEVIGAVYKAWNGYGEEISLGVSGIAESGDNEGKHYVCFFPVDKSGIKHLGWFTSVLDVQGMMEDAVRAWILSTRSTW